MKFKPWTLGPISFLVLFLIVAFVPTVLPARVLNDKLQHRIGQAVGIRHGKANIRTIEKNLLGLLNEFHKPEKKERIYFYLGQLGGKGLDRKKARNYCLEALKYPSDPLDACKMYAGAGDFQGGLNFIQSLLKISSKQEVPVVVNCDTPDDNDPCWKQHEESLKAAEEVNLQNNLLMWRDIFVGNLRH